MGILTCTFFKCFIKFEIEYYYFLSGLDGTRDTWNKFFQHSRAEFWDWYNWREQALYMQDFFKRSGEFGEGALTIIGVGVSPIAIAELIPLAWANFTVTTEGAEYKAAVNFGSQMIQTNGDIRDVNIIELGLSTFQVGIPQLF